MMITITGDFDLPSELRSSIEQYHMLRHIRKMPSRAALFEAIRETRIYIIGESEYLDEEVLAYALNLRHIIVLGTSKESFLDTSAAEDLGIAVHNTPTLNTDAVAEFSISSLILMESRAIFSALHTREGLSWPQPIRRTISDLTLGIIGMGSIGQNVSERLRKLYPGAKLRYYSRTRKFLHEKRLSIEYLEIRDLLTECDVLFVHMPYANKERPTFDKELLSYSKVNQGILNFSNPKLFCEDTLFQGISNGQLAYVLFDGFYKESYENLGKHSEPPGLHSLPIDKFVGLSHIASLRADVNTAIVSEGLRLAAGLADSSSQIGPC